MDLSTIHSFGLLIQYVKLELITTASQTLMTIAVTDLHVTLILWEKNKNGIDTMLYKHTFQHCIKLHYHTHFSLSIHKGWCYIQYKENKMN